MPIHSTASELNFRKSVKKYLVDNLSPVPVTFDKGLKDPVLGGRSTKKWLSVLFGDIERGYLTEAWVQVYVLTRQDAEGDEQAGLSDSVLAVLSDRDQTDGFRRIPLYDASLDPWSEVGSIIVQEVLEGGSFVLADETKVKEISARLRWGSKV